MPRPKVKPQDRQRSARACLPCKASKIRCDAATPCGPCLKRERMSTCVYLESSRKRQKTTHQDSPLPTPGLDDTSPRFETSPAKSSHAAPVQPIGTSVPVSNFATVTATTTPTPEPGNSASRLTQSRMLLSSKGEKCMLSAIDPQPCLTSSSVYWRECLIVVPPVPTADLEEVHGAFLLYREPVQGEHA